MKNVSIWFQQKSIPQLSLIQGINNYVQINTYWSYIVQICIFINLASNILLLASKKCFPTSQGLVGAGMYCRALTTLCDKACQWLATGWRFSPGTAVSSTNKTYRQNIAELLLKVALNTITPTPELYQKPCFEVYLIFCKFNLLRDLVWTRYNPFLIPC
jgi:hypothetical protein